MRKSKGQTVDLLYTNKDEANKKRKSKPKNKINNKKNNTKRKQTNNKEIINLDNEIIIGLTPKKEETENKGKKVSSKKTKKSSTKVSRKKEQKINKKKPKKRTVKNVDNTRSKTRTKKKISLKIVKWFIIAIMVIMAIILFMMSSIFNIKEIVVINNKKISSEDIINLSTLEPNINMFKITNGTIRKNIKTNPYIEDVKIKRNLNGTVTLDIQERVPTYMLKIEKTYAYINNQGHILEISEKPLKTPIITGFKTPQEEIKVGNRLIVEDLEKLEDVLKIMESAKNISMDNIITEINIDDPNDYKLSIPSEKKTVRFGDCSNVNIKLLKIQVLIDKEKGKKGEIYFQDSERTVFKSET